MAAVGPLMMNGGAATALTLIAALPAAMRGLFAASVSVPAVPSVTAFVKVCVPASAAVKV